MPDNNLPFPIDPDLTAITVAYRNKVYIADQVLPRVEVGTKVYKYSEYPLKDGFQTPDTKVGRKGKPNEVELGSEEKESQTKDYGLDYPIPQHDIDQALKSGRKDPRDRAVMSLSDYIALDREMRVAAAVQNAANYDYSEALVGTDKFSDAASKALDTLLYALDQPLLRPNQVTMSQEVWTVVRTHSQIVKAIHGNSGDEGVATHEQLARLLEVDRVLVGPSRKDTARKGQAVNLARIWGPAISLTYIDPLADSDGGLTFGFTAEYGSRQSGSEQDKSIGMWGGQRVRVGESLDEKIIAPAVGYLITDVL
ncbi:hypothetical protein [Emcibacter sp.]|uniref:hypothetical protein n=1 Tax=Emcibacter sp. TaxID=1979954 RepID=UPI002AA95DC7|nr:hypothetical protein [Emcibacter sp.]